MLTFIRLKAPKLSVIVNMRVIQEKQIYLYLNLD